MNRMIVKIIVSMLIIETIGEVLLILKVIKLLANYIIIIKKEKKIKKTVLVELFYF